MPLPRTLPYSTIAKLRAEHLLYTHWKSSIVAHKVRTSTATPPQLIYRGSISLHNLIFLGVYSMERSGSTT